MDAVNGVRAPKQGRTREAWQRVLEVGVELLREGGLEALTVTAVCRRAGVSPPSLYARVDGRAGLIAAVYEHVMSAVQRTEHEVFGPFERGLRGDDEDGRAGAALPELVGAAVELFRRRADLLGPVMAASLRDERIRERGAAELMRFVERLAPLLCAHGCVGHGCVEHAGVERAAVASGCVAARDVAAMLFAELTSRTLFGFTGAQAAAAAALPDDEVFCARLVRIAEARLRAPVD